jgi:hypothetical protein
MQATEATTMVRHLPVLLLVALLAAGCGAAREPAWGYSGPDEGLKHPSIGEAFEAWQRRAGNVRRVAQEACMLETGYSGTSRIWNANTEAFKACMKVRGWATYSNPL